MSKKIQQFWTIWIWFWKSEDISSLWKEYWTEKIGSIPPSPCINHTLLYYMMLLDTVHICKQLTEHKSQTRHRQTCCFMWEYCQVKNTLRQSEANEDNQLTSIGDLICVLYFIEFVLRYVWYQMELGITTSTDVQIIIIGIL